MYILIKMLDRPRVRSGMFNMRPGRFDQYYYV